MAQTSITKSIDVGSMFLMDLSVHESDLSSDLANMTLNERETTTAVFNMNRGQQKLNTKSPLNYQLLNGNRHSSYSIEQSIADHRSMATAIQEPDYLASSLDRLAMIINCDDQQRETNNIKNDGHSVKIVEPQPPPAVYSREPHQSSCSLSDESFGASSSSGTSLSASFSAASEQENEDKGSTTTREDSGVLDMKDLEGQLNNSYDNENDEELCHPNHNQRFEQEKPISSNITSTNLINKSVNNNHSNHHNFIRKHQNRPGKPADNNDISSNNNSSKSKRSVSASLPIQVPVRQMKKDLNKMKLNLVNEELATENHSPPKTMNRECNINTNDNSKQRSASHDYQNDRRHGMPFTPDDDDAFLEQEFNANHHNHYPIDEFEEHPRAEEDPMGLFASIQALARSLHEDAELFGSLPPKRLLESPIRSIALV